MSRNARTCVARVKADELQAHRLIGHCRHNTEVALIFLYGEHVAHRLKDAAGRERGERRLHCGDERVPPENRTHAHLVEIPHDRVSKAAFVTHREPTGA